MDFSFLRGFSLGRNTVGEASRVGETWPDPVTRFHSHEGAIISLDRRAQGIEIQRNGFVKP